MYVPLFNEVSVLVSARSPLACRLMSCKASLKAREVIEAPDTASTVKLFVFLAYSNKELADLSVLSFSSIISGFKSLPYFMLKTFTFTDIFTIFKLCHFMSPSLRCYRLHR